MINSDRGLQAAVGYLELGMLVEANEEIENLAPELKSSSAVLGVRLEIYRAAKKWSLMEVVARELWKRHPEEPVYWNDLAWAVRRADSLKAGQKILLNAAERFPSDAMTQFNLGCYACQLGDIDQSKERVRKAIELDAKFKMLALDDPDLEPLWKRIEGGEL
jgi:tetratricopeptide (TPR) repeat protein